jgi:hypothetical protein
MTSSYTNHYTTEDLVGVGSTHRRCGVEVLTEREGRELALYRHKSVAVVSCGLDMTRDRGANVRAGGRLDYV